MKKMAKHKHIKCRGISYRVDEETGELWFETIFDAEAHEQREWWCICDDNGNIWSLYEIRKGSIPPEEILLSVLEKADDTRHCYKISFLEYEKARKDARRATENSRPQVEKNGVVIQEAIERIPPKDNKMLTGQRYREVEIRNRQVKKRMNGKWENMFEIPDKFLDQSEQENRRS